MQSGTIWSSKVFKIKEMVSNHDAVIAKRECQFSCYTEIDRCNSFAFDHPTCYLMDWHVDSELISITDTLEVSYRIRKFKIIYKHRIIKM